MNDRVSMFFFHLLLGHHSLATVYVSLRNAHSILYVQHPHAGAARQCSRNFVPNNISSYRHCWTMLIMRTSPLGVAKE